MKIHAEQAKGKVNYLPSGNSLNYIMAQHTPALHHQQQQQPSQQQIVSTQSQGQQQQVQASSQNNNLSNYAPPHPSQTHTFNQLPPGGVFMHSHGVSPVAGAMYVPCPAGLPGNVYVNNVTANVNLHGYVAHSVPPQYISGTTPAFMQENVQQNMPHVPEQSTQVQQNTNARGGLRRGRDGGTRNNGRRGEFNAHRRLASPAPPEVVNAAVDTQGLGTTYPHYYSYPYTQQFYGPPAQNIGHPQAQQATGTPLYLTAGHVPMFPGPHMFNYPQILYPATMLAPEYQLVDDKCDEQAQGDAMIPHIWSGHIPMEYSEEYMNPELVDDVNHNPSPLTSSDTPSMLSPSYSIYESQMHSTVEIQQQLNTLHIYDPQQQHMQAEEQISECQSLQSLQPSHLETSALQTVPLETPITDQQVSEPHLDSVNNNEEILTEVPPAAISVEQTVQSPSTFVNNAPIQQEPPVADLRSVENLAPVNSNEAIVTGYINETVPNIQSPQDEKSFHSKVEIENQFVPATIVNEDSAQIANKSISWTNQTKKSMASVAVTATPSASKQNIPLSANKSVSTSSTQQIAHVKNYGVMKTPSSPVASNESLNEKKLSQTQIDLGKSTASIASTVVPQQLQDCKTTTQGPKSDIVPSAMKETAKAEPEIFVRSKKDEATSTASTPPVQQAASWASLFSNKSSVNISSSIIPPPTASATIGKKPVAKVFPFEGTTNFAPPVTPGNMSYSAASAQGISASQHANISASAKPKSVIAPTVSSLHRDSTDEWSLKFADYLTKYKIDYSTVSLRPRGLMNRSNYCYINSILQALVGCPPFYNLMKSIPKQPSNMSTEKTNTPTINAMMQLISEFSHLPPGVRLNRREKGQKKDDLSGDLQCDTAFEPTGIYKLWNATRADVEGRQEDAEEFLGYVLNKLNDEMLEVIKLIAKPSAEQNGDSNLEADDGEDWQMIYNNRNKGSVTRQTDFGRTPLSDIFRGELRSRLQREGELSTDVIQPFFTLQLNIEKAASVKEALEILVGRDQLEGVTCSKTNQEVVAWQQMTLEKLPVVLILHLKWFDYKPDGCTKIVKTVEFPVELKIDAKILANKKYSQKQRLYRLFAVVYHDGKEASKGHYITDVYHTGYMNWLRFDDSAVKPVSENNVLRPRAPRVPYLLYYRRCDTVQPTQNTANNK